MQVAYEIFIISNFFHTCVAARSMEKLSKLSCVRGYHIYQDVWDVCYWRMDVPNICSANILWNLIS